MLLLVTHNRLIGSTTSAWLPSQHKEHIVFLLCISCRMAVRSSEQIFAFNQTCLCGEVCKYAWSQEVIIQTIQWSAFRIMSMCLSTDVSPTNKIQPVYSFPGSLSHGRQRQVTVWKSTFSHQGTANRYHESQVLDINRLHCEYHRTKTKQKSKIENISEINFSLWDKPISRDLTHLTHYLKWTCSVGM